MTTSRREFLIGGATGVAVAGWKGALAQGKPTTLNVQYAWARTFEPILKEIADQFTRRHPDVRVSFLAPATDYEDMAQKTLRAAITGGLPDVAFHGLHRADLLARQNLVVPLSPLIKAEQDWDRMGYDPALLRLASVSGEPFGLPFAVSISSVYYNLDLVRRAGGDPERLPATWPGIFDLQRKIQVLGQGVSGLYVDYYFNDNNFTLHALVQTQGGSMATPDHRVAFDGPEGLQALRWLRQAGEGGMVDMTVTQAYQSFVSGTLGILVASSSRIAQLSEGAKDKFAVRVTPLPRAPNGRVPGGGAGAMIHARDPQTQRAAWEFIKFATGPIGSTEMVRRSGYVPGNTLAGGDPKLLGRFYAENPNHRVMLEQIPVLDKFYNWAGENSLKIPNVIRDHLQQVVTLKATPDEVLPRMAREVRALLPST